MKNLLVAQSGGPIQLINATVAGVITAAMASGEVDEIWGAVNGIKGVLEERFVNLREQISNTQDLDVLCQTPAAALGSCRFKLKNIKEDSSQFEEYYPYFSETYDCLFYLCGRQRFHGYWWTNYPHTVKSRESQISALWARQKPSITIWWVRITVRDLAQRQNILEPRLRSWKEIVTYMIPRQSPLWK